jgi:hypothetical protein
MDFRFIAFMGVMIILMIGMVALDYRRLRRGPISAAEINQVKPTAIVHWSLSADEVKRAQGVERHRRWRRIQFILQRNLRIATVYAVIGGAGLLILVLVSTLSGRNTFDASQLLIGLFPAIIIYPIMLLVTVFIGGDALGLAGLRNVFGLQPAIAVTVYIHRTGVLWEPGGFQPFAYRPASSELLDGDQTVLLIVTTRGNLRQDFYIPVPTGHAAEVDLVRSRLYIQS